MYLFKQVKNITLIFFKKTLTDNVRVNLNIYTHALFTNA